MSSLRVVDVAEEFETLLPQAGVMSDDPHTLVLVPPRALLDPNVSVPPLPTTMTTTWSRTTMTMPV